MLKIIFPSRAEGSTFLAKQDGCWQTKGHSR